MEATVTDTNETDTTTRVGWVRLTDGAGGALFDVLLRTSAWPAPDTTLNQWRPL